MADFMGVRWPCHGTKKFHMEFKVCCLDLEFWDLESGIWNLEPNQVSLIKDGTGKQFAKPCSKRRPRPR
jgi:hypothetical protein